MSSYRRFDQDLFIEIDHYLTENKQNAYIDMDDMARALQNRSYKWTRMKRYAFSNLVKDTYNEYCKSQPRVFQEPPPVTYPHSTVVDCDIDVEDIEPDEPYVPDIPSASLSLPSSSILSKQMSGLYASPTLCRPVHQHQHQHVQAVQHQMTMTPNSNETLIKNRPLRYKKNISIARDKEGSPTSSGSDGNSLSPSVTDKNQNYQGSGSQFVYNPNNNQHQHIDTNSSKNNLNNPVIEIAEDSDDLEIIEEVSSTIKGRSLMNNQHFQQQQHCESASTQTQKSFNSTPTSRYAEKNTVNVNLNANANNSNIQAQAEPALVIRNEKYESSANANENNSKPFPGLNMLKKNEESLSNRKGILKKPSLSKTPLSGERELEKLETGTGGNGNGSSGSRNKRKHPELSEENLENSPQNYKRKITEEYIQSQNTQKQNQKQQKYEGIPPSPSPTSSSKKRKSFTVNESNYFFDDFGGSTELIDEVSKLLFHLKHPEIYKSIGITPPRGLLLHGPPGCGKTLLVNAIAGELNLPMLNLVATELVSGISGESESNIRDMFEQALELAPCVIFIDQIDSITQKRESAQREMERRIVAQLLSCIDDLGMKEKGDQILLIGATNRPETIDSGLRRAGRFDREICLGIPNEGTRFKILRVLCRNVKLAPEFDFNLLAKLTPGFVGADLQALIREASICAINNMILTKNEKSDADAAKEKDKEDENDEAQEKMEVESNVTVEFENRTENEIIEDFIEIIEDEEEKVEQEEIIIIDVTSLKDEENTEEVKEKEESEKIDVDVDEKVEEKEESPMIMEVQEEEDKSAGENTENGEICQKSENTEITEITEIENVEVEVEDPVKVELEKEETQKNSQNNSEEEILNKNEGEKSLEKEKEEKSTEKIVTINEKTEEIVPMNENETEDANANNTITAITATVTKKKTKYHVDWLKLNKDPNLEHKDFEDIFIRIEDFEKALKVVQPSAKREGFATVPNTTWNDIGALKDIRDELQVSILGPVKHSEAFEALGLSNPAGVLLCGPPGCGKTLLAKAVANEAGINFISVKGPELLNMYVGESERAVRQCFLRAKNSAPCVIFFDELDALCPKRSDNHEAGSRLVNQLLTEMDGIETRIGVFVMAATNRPDIIDPAILRPGRLDKILFIDLPTPHDRVEILRTITKNGTSPVLNEDCNLEIIAKDEKCENYTGADLASLVREASIAAFREHILEPSIRNEKTCDYDELKVSRRHFEISFRKTKASVSEKDREKYRKMKENFSSVLA